MAHEFFHEMYKMYKNNKKKALFVVGSSNLKVLLLKKF